MDQLRRQLMRRAHLFDDPAAYEAGVRDALAALGTEHASGEQVALHVAGADAGGDQARRTAAMRAHPAAGTRPLRAVGGSTG